MLYQYLFYLTILLINFDNKYVLLSVKQLLTLFIIDKSIICQDILKEIFLYYTI